VVVKTDCLAGAVVVDAVSPPSEPQADATSASDVRIKIKRFNIEIPLLVSSAMMISSPDDRRQRAKRLHGPTSKE
ncbi:MAG: hypothetical protein VX287_01395, partial [Actinomycetota bacterium]|nr:hypothetical protein [Actinomycetota bacterium]